MKVAIRTDASVSIGTGHLTRCLTFAGKLHKRGAEVIFILGQCPEALRQLIIDSGYPIYMLNSLSDCRELSAFVDASRTIEIVKNHYGKADWIVVDHYGLDIQWEMHVRSVAKRLMVIDDLANREHDCDVLLDQNYYHQMEQRYLNLVPTNCIKLLGPQYVLLRDEFLLLHEKSKKKRSPIMSRLFVFFGGSDPTNETLKVLKALNSVDLEDMYIDIVVGSSNPNKLIIEVECKRHPNIHYHCQINNIAELMIRADFSIGAGGSATWERSYLGLPCMTVITADNQEETTLALQKVEAIKYIGWHMDIQVHHMTEEIVSAIKNPIFMSDIGTRAAELMREHSEGWIDLIY